VDGVRRRVGLVLLCAVLFGGGAYLIYVLWATSGGSGAPGLTLARPAHGTLLGRVLGGHVPGARGGGVQADESPRHSGGQAQSQWAPARPGDKAQSAPARSGGESPPESDDGSQVSPASPSTPRPHGRVPTVDPQGGSSFSIAVAGDRGAPLYPGGAPQTIALTVRNPGEAAIYVTSLSVTVPSGPQGCDPLTNLGVVQSDVSSAAPLQVPAHGSVTLPARGHSAPTIQLLDLPVDQDACQGAHFSLSFSGSAHS
jgi:hypothetical protein